jgi:HAD superfamily hydrolase (TIGR01509 family)
MKISAVIFDLNGTILEDEDENGKAFNKVLKSLGVESGTAFPQTKGIGVKGNWPILIKKFDITTSKSIEILTKETQDAYLEEINDITVRPGFTDFIESIKDGGIKVALATSNTWEIAEKVLNKVGLGGIFDAVTTIDEVVFGKPDPALFTTTADKLEVERESCLVIEDAQSGIIAAKLAGMKAVVFSGKEDGDENLADADLVVENFSEITPKIIEEL